jgi:WD40 repeat protein
VFYCLAAVRRALSCAASAWPEGGSNAKDPKPRKSFNMNAWVTPELKGTIVKLDDKELDKADPVRGKPAAAHSIHGDGQGTYLVGTVCNEIYEISFDDPKKTMCYVQGHYDEMWGLAMHPLKNEFCSVAEDETLRVWDPAKRAISAMAKLGGPGRCCAYSPDGSMIAVGIGGKFAKVRCAV